MFFASLAGRVVPFDEFSFARWRAQRNEMPESPEARFAVDLATTEFVAVEESPLNGVSLGTLATRGAAWTLAGWSLWDKEPLHALGIIILGEFGVVIGLVTRGFREELYLATRYHLRRLFGVPPDRRP